MGKRNKKNRDPKIRSDSSWNSWAYFDSRVELATVARLTSDHHYFISVLQIKMPTFVVNTNVSRIPDGLAKRLVPVVAKALGKPESYVVVQINAGVNLSWGNINNSESKTRN